MSEFVNEWKFKETLDGRRGDYTNALKDIHLTLVNLAEPLSKLEFVDSEIERNVAISVIQEAKIKLDRLMVHL